MLPRLAPASPLTLLPDSAEREASYWAQSRAPLASLALVAPLLVAYEVGVVWLGPQAVRNGADVWLRTLLDQLGFGQYFLLPLLTVGVLLGWHHITGQRWRVPRRVLAVMALESAGLALALLLVARLQGALFGNLLGGWESGAQPQGAWLQNMSGGAWPAAIGSSPLSAQLVAYLGAGIYEEVLFRLIALPAVALLLVASGVPGPRAWLAALLVTSLAFAAAHYIGPEGDAWGWFSFSFRLLAGAFFAALFVYRGFGVSAATHAGYDLLVALT